MAGTAIHEPLIVLCSHVHLGFLEKDCISTCLGDRNLIFYDHYPKKIWNQPTIFESTVLKEIHETVTTEPLHSSHGGRAGDFGYPSIISLPNGRSLITF